MFALCPPTMCSAAPGCVPASRAVQGCLGSAVELGRTGALHRSASTPLPIQSPSPPANEASFVRTRRQWAQRAVLTTRCVTAFVAGPRCE